MARNFLTRSSIRCSMTDFHSLDPVSRTLLPAGVSLTIELVLVRASPDDEARAVPLHCVGLGLIGFGLAQLGRLRYQFAPLGR